MRPIKLNDIINISLSNEVRKRIIMESTDIYEMYQVTCEGHPVQMCESEEEANEIVNKLEKEHPGKQFIIEKRSFKSYEEMLDELDKMGQELEEKENKHMRKKKIGTLAEALLDAKKSNLKRIIINENVYDVEESWKEMEEEESQCEQCNMEEDDMIDSEEGDDFGSDYDKLSDGDMEDIEPMTEEMKSCNECGGEMKEGVCLECGLKESKKKRIIVKESELVSLISNMVTEAKKKELTSSVPGLTVTKRAQSTSKKENDSHAKEVATKLKKYLTFDGNDNPEFPKPIGKGDKMAYRNTSDNEKKIEDKRGETASDLTFDYEPTEGFKDRVKKALEGDSTMGNSSDAVNVVKDKVGKQIVDKKKRKVDNKKNKKDVSWGHSWITPADVDVVAESKKDKLLKEEIKKINKLSFYDKKTQ